MTRSRIPLRHALFGVLFAASLVFGSAQAFAAPQLGVPIPVSCNPYDRNSAGLCSDACNERGYSRGFCANDGGCRCFS